MPANIVKTPKEERMWNQAKTYVSRETGKKESDFSDQDWGLVTKIFKDIKAKYQNSTLPEGYGDKNISERMSINRHIGKEFTYRGKQMMTIYYEPNKKTFIMAPIVRGKPLSPAAMTYSPAFPGAGGVNSPTVAPGPNSGMGPMVASRVFDGNDLFEDMNMISFISEQMSPKEAMAELSRKFFDLETKYKVVDSNIRGGYISGYEPGEQIEIEREVFFDMNDQVGNFMERQVNLSMPRQRLQTAVKVKNLIADVLDGTLQVNDDDGTTAEFKKLAKIAAKDYSYDLLQPQFDIAQ